MAIGDGPRVRPRRWHNSGGTGVVVKAFYSIM